MASSDGFPKWPTFHKRELKESFRYPDPKQIKIEPDRVFLPKAGWVRMVTHRLIAGKVKNVTVSTVAGDWFVSEQTELEAAIRVNRGSAVGIDLRSAQPIVLSDGKVFGIPRATPAERRRLEDAHRTIHRQKNDRPRQVEAPRTLVQRRANENRARLEIAPRTIRKTEISSKISSVVDRRQRSHWPASPAARAKCVPAVAAAYI